MTQPPFAMTPPPPSSTDASKPSDAARRQGDNKRDKDNGSVKETIESILVAFILAFIFRAFVVEAFVIPTGSMAPTLLGAHMRFRCNDCGWRFDANYSPKQTAGDDLYIPSQSERSHKVFCPNCGYKIPEYDPQDPSNDAQKPDVFYGDRILVLKYLYLLEAPQRWDVVVFKSPDVRAPDDAGFGGESSPYQQNYIKRLVGRPGESIVILDGDIYVGKPGQDIGEYEIQTKPRHVQEALWRVIYDNDFHPQRLKRDDQGGLWKQPWTVREGGGWDVGAGNGKTPADGRVFRFDNASGESTLSFDRDANPIMPRIASSGEPYAFTDWLAYDVDVSPPMNVVHDLKLAFFYERSAGDGS
ncbi:MAG: S26 family signal peptidase, partial [Tepidisphaeraceae bacterium]